jgi:hypothetical protein
LIGDLNINMTEVDDIAEVFYPAVKAFRRHPVLPNLVTLGHA